MLLRCRCGIRTARVQPWRAFLPRTTARAATVGLAELRQAQQGDLGSLPEVQQRTLFADQLRSGSVEAPEASRHSSTATVGLSAGSLMRVIEAGMVTQLLHVESRIASALGQGFYTIGPGGEELLGAVGLRLNQTDSVALHYRHLATSVARALSGGKSRAEVLQDRARGYTVSTLDPVTGGRHCAIGGGEYDFIVTSTLASQSPPAVGRALGAQLAQHLGVQGSFPSDSVSYVSVGDGSVNNAHFLAATNLADYAEHRSFRCPVVFGISDNNLCISLRGYGWLDSFLQKQRMALYECNGNDVLDVYDAAGRAIAYARTKRKPAMLVMRNLARRFGHAATDRQNAYLTADEISGASAVNPLAGACGLAVSEGLTSFAELSTQFETIQREVEEAFNEAAEEPKFSSREQVQQHTFAPLRAVDNVSPGRGKTERGSVTVRKDKGKRDVMRKHINRVLAELMEEHKHCVYLGEDVAHGGYYLVTDKLAERFPMRVRDFPPDETTLIGAAVGYSQAGLFPIVEIPYAKYLDCGSDMFHEAVISNWLSAGKRPNGMIIRLQGFDRGVFGGNFHTHNTLHIPPGLDVVCYSNGEDYVRGMRYCAQQAMNGRVVMSVDSTNLLNLRHVHDKDDAWRKPFPSPDERVLGFDDIIKYTSNAKGFKGKQLAIVSYGNGVVASLQAQKALREEHGWESVHVIDSPYLSDVPAALEKEVPGYDAVVFADVCKEAQHPLAAHVMKLQSRGALPLKWRCIAAANTYNPLGSTITFLSAEDVIAAANSMK